MNHIQLMLVVVVVLCDSMSGWGLLTYLNLEQILASLFEQGPDSLQPR